MVHLKIACASIVGINWLPKVLKEFVTTYPDVKISLITGWSSEIVRAIYDGEAHSGNCQRTIGVEREKNALIPRYDVFEWILKSRDWKKF